jgi:hypothetical protein
MKVKAWELLEIKCGEYLHNTYYGSNNLQFKVAGGSNSNTSDIQVIKDNKCGLDIECKSSNAQSGQFVLFVDEANKKFIYSPKNKTPYDDAVKLVISEMDSKFDECCVSSANDLPIANEVIVNWVKNHYINTKHSKYGITESNNEFIIFPISKMDEYFDFTAQYRVKKSGSSRPSKRNVAEISILLESLDSNAHIEFVNRDCFATFNYHQDEFVLSGEKYRYKFSKESDRYKIRRLSNTYNANFIVTINLKKFKQDLQDLKEFEHDLMML